MSDRPGDWFQTWTGKQFWVLDPRPEDVCIEDIGHSLAHLCRFNGHCRTMYSVAQHSVFVSELVQSSEPAVMLWALLHDSAEAYVGDMIRPLKLSLGSEFKQVEENVFAAIVASLMPWMMRRRDLNDVIRLTKEADEVALATEKRDVMPPGVGTWKVRAEPARTRIVPMQPPEAEFAFQHRYSMLRGLVR